MECRSPCAWSHVAVGLFTCCCGICDRTVLSCEEQDKEQKSLADVVGSHDSSLRQRKSVFVG